MRTQRARCCTARNPQSAPGHSESGYVEIPHTGGERLNKPTAQRHPQDPHRHPQHPTTTAARFLVFDSRAP